MDKNTFLLEASFPWRNTSEARLIEGNSILPDGLSVKILDGYDTCSNLSRTSSKFFCQDYITLLSLTASEEGGRRRWKKMCPVCGRIGILQTRGNSSRIIHYQWLGNKRTFIAHKLDQ